MTLKIQLRHRIISIHITPLKLLFIFFWFFSFGFVVSFIYFFQEEWDPLSVEVISQREVLLSCDISSFVTLVESPRIWRRCYTSCSEEHGLYTYEDTNSLTAIFQACVCHCYLREQENAGSASNEDLKRCGNDWYEIPAYRTAHVGGRDMPHWPHALLGHGLALTERDEAQVILSYSPWFMDELKEGLQASLDSQDRAVFHHTYFHSFPTLDKPYFARLISGTEHNPRQYVLPEVYIKLKIRKKYTSFYHFILGEFLPVINVIVSHNHHEDNICIVAGEKCSKLQTFRHFYKELPFKMRISSREVVPPDSTCYEIQRLDKPSLKFADCPSTMSMGFEMPAKQLKRAVEWVKQHAASLPPDPLAYRPPCDVLFQKRDSTGRQARGIANLDEVFERFKVLYPGLSVRYSVPERSRPLMLQIQEYLTAKMVIAEHGAGLIHALWTAPGTNVVEIGSRRKLGKRYFSRMAGCMGYTLTQVEVEDSHTYPRIHRIAIDSFFKQISPLMENFI